MTDHTDTKPLDPVTFDGAQPRSDRPDPVDLRSAQTATKDKSAHRRHHWLYEDLLN
ncbi:MAG: hypothetical protein AAGM84_13310 [Pseudomonadota bacterium]